MTDFLRDILFVPGDLADEAAHRELCHRDMSPMERPPEESPQTRALKQLTKAIKLATKSEHLVVSATTDPLLHLSRRCDQLEKENERLRQIIRHYESKGPADLPDHHVDGLYGSPN